MRKTLALLAAAFMLAATPAFAHDHWRDRDDNPPGWRGGPGTNWENPPGLRGGRGASPDRHWPRTYYGGGWWVWHPHRHAWFRDHDGNPPGPRGGPGTNWENPPGLRGGPGASPDRRW